MQVERGGDAQVNAFLRDRISNKQDAMDAGAADVFGTLDRLLAGEIPLADFEAWVYSTPAIEAGLGAGAHLELLAFDYRGPHALQEAATWVGALYERLRPGMLVRDRAHRLACGLLFGTIPLPAAVHGLANLYYGGEDWIPTIFVGLSSELDDVVDPAQYPLWEPGALAAHLERWAMMRENVVTAATTSAREFLAAEFPDRPCA
jgi:hypothetical protein